MTNYPVSVTHDRPGLKKHGNPIWKLLKENRMCSSTDRDNLYDSAAVFRRQAIPGCLNGQFDHMRHPDTARKAFMALALAAGLSVGFLAGVILGGISMARMMDRARQVHTQPPTPRADGNVRLKTEPEMFRRNFEDKK